MNKRQENEVTKPKLHYFAVIFGLSAWFIYLATAGQIMMQTIIPLIILLIILELFLNKDKKALLHKNDIPLVIMVVIGIISTFVNCIIYSEYADISQLYQVLYFVLILAWYIILSNKEYSEKDYRFVKWSYLAVGLIAALQVISFHEDSGRSSIVSLFGAKFDPNHTGAFLSLIVVFLIIDLLNSKLVKKERIIESILLVILIIGNALVGSRAAFLGTAIGSFFALLHYFSKKINVWKMLILILMATAIIFVMINLENILPEWLYNRYLVNSYKDDSNYERVAIWKNALNGVKNSPLIGYGFRMFNELPQYAYSFGLKKIPSSIPAHNTYLDILVYTGILGGVYFVVFLINIFKTALRNDKKYLPLIIDLLFLTMIVGADKSIYFWTVIIFLSIIGKNIKKNDVARR